MIKRLTRISLAVRNQKEALEFYTKKLGMEIKADLPMGPMRWLTVAPPEQKEIEIVLQSAEWFQGEEKERFLRLVGHQPTFVFETDDCRKTFGELQNRGVEFTRPPTEQPYGLEAIFKDLYGNEYSLLQPRMP